MKIRVNQSGLSIEEVLWRHLQTQLGDDERAAKVARGGFVEATLNLNPGLARTIAFNADSVPAGTVITLPDVPTNDETAVVRLWQ